MSFDTGKTLQELEGVTSGQNSFDSSLVSTVNRLYRKPLSEFTVEDLRLMISQNVGLKFLVPLAVGELARNPFASGDYYPGDLLSSVLMIEREFWREHPEMYWQVYELVAGLPLPLKELLDSIEKFQDDSPPEG